MSVPETAVVGSVRDADPAVAVILTDVAFVDCQVKVTVWLAVIVFVFAENTRVGVAGGLLTAVVLPVPPPQAERPKSADSSTPR